MIFNQLIKQRYLRSNPKKSQELFLSVTINQFAELNVTEPRGPRTQVTNRFICSFTFRTTKKLTVPLLLPQVKSNPIMAISTCLRNMLLITRE